MASIINASTSGAGGVITTADASGVLELQSGGTTVATIRASGVNAGIQVAANAAPAFSAYAGANQLITTATFTKAQINTEVFDTNSNYDTTTYRFTPTVAGYYQINGGVNSSASAASTRTMALIYKNGSMYTQGPDITLNGGGSSVSSIVYMNGSTDYLELYAFIAGTTPGIFAGSPYTYFNGSLVRSA